MNAEHQHGKSTLLSPGNVVLGVCLLLGLYVAVLRFSQGLGGATHLTDANPWGIWVFLNLALAACFTATASIAAFSYYFLGLTHARSLVRPSVLLSLLGFAGMVVVSFFDLGQPWRMLVPIICSQGTTSVLFGVALCTLLSLIVLVLQLSPACAKDEAGSCGRSWMVGLTAFGVVLTFLFQGALGGLFLLAPSKMHPLWFSTHLPLLFLGSSLFGGMAMIIAVSLIAHRCSKSMSEGCQISFQTAIFGLAKAASFIMMAYMFARLLAVSMNNAWAYLGTGYGALFFVELVGFVALPSFLFAIGAREKKICITKTAAIITLLGVVLNRLNLSIVGFNYQLPAAERYCPTWQELVLVAFVLALIAAGYRFFRQTTSVHGNAQGAC